MQLKYHEDIKWQDLPRIERPFFAQGTVRNELSRPSPKIHSGIFKNPLSDTYKGSRHNVDPQALTRLLRKIEEGSVLLVHTFEENVRYPAFIWKQDEDHPDKGQWTLSEHLYSASEYHFNLLLNQVKKPLQRGSVKKPASEPLFPGANMADTRRAIANTAIDTTNTATDVARKRELAEYTDRYPQLNSGVNENPLAIDNLKYDNEAYGEFAGTIAGAIGMVGTRKPPKSLLGVGKKNIDAPDTTRLGQSGGSTGWIDEADGAYDIIRNRTDDIELISQNTGFKTSNIEKIKNHLFYDSHKKYDDYGDDFVEWGRLDSDAKISDSWNRLIEGTHGADDIKLLKHEAAERKILELWGPGSGKAHKRAHGKYPSPIQD